MTLNPIWKTNFTRKTAPILIGKKRKHASDVIAALALLGPSTTREIARFVLSKTPDYEFKPVRGNDAMVREQIFYNLLHGRLRKNRSDEKYLGLITEKYVVNVGTKLNEKKKNVSLYSLTLKGCFFALGFEFTDGELTSFIKNASKNHIYFAYINSILQNTSISFVKQIFTRPIQQLIKKYRISLYDDIQFYFSNIAEATEYELHYKMIGALEFWPMYNREKYSQKFKELQAKKEIEIIMDNTFYSEKERDFDWIDRMINYFYPTNDEREFYEMYFDGQIDINLLYKTMRTIHFAYFKAHGLGRIPRQTNRLPPHSKSWNEHAQRAKLISSSNKKRMTGLEFEKYLKQSKKK